MKSEWSCAINYNHQKIRKKMCQRMYKSFANFTTLAWIIQEAWLSQHIKCIKLYFYIHIFLFHSWNISPVEAGKIDQVYHNICVTFRSDKICGKIDMIHFKNIQLTNDVILINLGQKLFWAFLVFGFIDNKIFEYIFCWEYF